jgi:hypothetical protein
MVFNHTFLFEGITLNELSFLDGLISHLRVGASEDNFGPYICYVNNSIGAGVPCEADVQGKFVRVKITCMLLTINAQVIQQFELLKQNRKSHCSSKC